MDQLLQVVIQYLCISKLHLVRYAIEFDIFAQYYRLERFAKVDYLLALTPLLFFHWIISWQFIRFELYFRFELGLLAY